MAVKVEAATEEVMAELEAAMAPADWDSVEVAATAPEKVVALGQGKLANAPEEAKAAGGGADSTHPRAVFVACCWLMLTLMCSAAC